MSSGVTKRKIRKGTFSCWSCKRRKVRCGSDGEPGSKCFACRSKGWQCVTQEYREGHPMDHDAKTTRMTQGTSRERLRLDPSGHSSLPLVTAGTLDQPILSKIECLEDLSVRCRTLARHLYSTLPAAEVMSQVMSLGAFSKLPVHIRHFNTDLAEKDLPSKPSPEVAWASPTTTSSPLEQARSLLELAICLQQLDGESRLTLRIGDQDALKTLSDRYVDLVSTLVTSQDRLVSSLEGLRMLMLEITYHISTGDLRKGWLATCRVMSLSSLLSCRDLSPSQSAQLKALRRSAQQGEGYLALLLGLASSPFGQEGRESQTTADEGALAHLDQVHCSALQRIGRRNMELARRVGDDPPSAQYLGEDRADTREIDSELKASVALVPIRWWSTPRLDTTTGYAEAMQSTKRLLIQSHHHFIVMMLHQPVFLNQLLSEHTGKDAEHGALACITASQQLLRLFIAARRHHPGLAYRGADDKSYAAATVLLLAHIGLHQGAHSAVLGQQRVANLNLVYDTLDIIRIAASKQQDKVSAGYIIALTNLLETESGVHEGTEVSISLQPLHTHNSSGDVSHAACHFAVTLPYFGRLVGKKRHEFSEQSLSSNTIANCYLDTSGGLGTPSDGAILPSLADLGSGDVAIWSSSGRFDPTTGDDLFCFDFDCGTGSQ